MSSATSALQTLLTTCRAATQVAAAENLVHNALKVLAQTKEARQIVIRAERRSMWQIVFVRDTGCGLSDEVRGYGFRRIAGIGLVLPIWKCWSHVRPPLRWSIFTSIPVGLEW